MNKIACQIGLCIASCLFLIVFPLYTIFWVFPHFTSIITFEKEVSSKQIANHISKMLVMDTETNTLTKNCITDSFIETLKEAQADFDLTKVKIFSSAGEVLYSTNAKDIGELNTKPYFTDTVSKGKIFSKVVHENEKTMEGETVKKDVVETYVPLMREGHFKGAFEIYYDITYIGYSISNFIERSRIIIILVTALILLFILVISYLAIGYLKKQNETEKELQELKDKIPSLYNLSLDRKD